MGGGGTRVEYKAPPPDNTFAQFLQYQQTKEAAAEARAAQERADRQAAENARKLAGQTGYGSLKTGVEQQLRQGLLGYEDAASRLRDYALKYDMTPVEGDVAELGKLYTQEILPGRRATAVGSAYEEILGRQATEEEKSKALTRFQEGYYTSNQELRDSLYKTEEYQKKFNDNYLDNYYDTKFGSSVADRTETVEDPETGKKTTKVSKLRTFKFDPALLPTYSSNLEAKTGVSQPDFAKYFGEARSIEELEQGLQGVRDSRQFLYSAGLTNLQGEIDKETQKLKNESSKDLARIQAQGSLYNTLVGSFSFS